MSHSSDHHAARYPTQTPHRAGGTHGTAPGGETEPVSDRPLAPAPASGPVAEAARLTLHYCDNCNAFGAVREVEGLCPLCDNPVVMMVAVPGDRLAALESAASWACETWPNSDDDYYRPDHEDAMLALRKAIAYRAATGSGQAGAGTEGGTG